MSAKVIPFRTLAQLTAAALTTLTLHERLVISLRMYPKKEKST